MPRSRSSWVRRYKDVSAGLLRSMLLPGIVPAPGPDHEFVVSLGMRFHADGAIPASTLRGRRLISNSVLVADVVSHGAANLVHFIERTWKERNSSSSLRDGFERDRKSV